MQCFLAFVKKKHKLTSWAYHFTDFTLYICRVTQAIFPLGPHLQGYQSDLPSWAYDFIYNLYFQGYQSVLDQTVILSEEAEQLEEVPLMRE